jgi:hypothetical protein
MAHDALVASGVSRGVESGQHREFGHAQQVKASRRTDCLFEEIGYYDSPPPATAGAIQAAS